MPAISAVSVILISCTRPPCPYRLRNINIRRCRVGQYCLKYSVIVSPSYFPFSPHRLGRVLKKTKLNYSLCQQSNRKDYNLSEQHLYSLNKHQNVNIGVVPIRKSCRKADELGGWLHTETVCLYADSHPSKY